jgi:hypothetical protein
MSDKKSDVPEKNSRQWRKNESLIAKDPVLRQARDISEGFRPGTTSGSRVAGGSQSYKDGWDRIFGNKKDSDEDE